MKIPGQRLLFAAAVAAQAMVLCHVVDAAAAAQPSDDAMASIRPAAIRADMRFLSDDLLEGRGTGTRGYDIAAAYMATQFEGIGLSPAGTDGSYFQSVPLRSMTVDESKSSFIVERRGNRETLLFRQDYVSSGNPGRQSASVRAPVVFVGYGVTAPSQKYDDYRHVDVKGKIVAALYGAPKFQSALKAHYSATWVKQKNAAAHGAVGYITINDATLEGMYPFAERVRDLALPQFRWLDAQGRANNYYPELQATAVLSMAASKRFFEGSRHSVDDVYAAAKAGKLTSFALPIVAKIDSATQWKDVRSPNVAAKLEGSDPELKNEYVVYTAHLDHLGVGTPVQGDGIYNGALDNASGSAVMLEIARAFSRMNPKPRRSTLFVAVTGEESGLLGSDYFAAHPTVTRDSIVADINTDEDQMLWPLRDIVAYGAEHSTLDAVVQQATQRLQLVESPDPFPDEVDFIRSDQYSFVKQGIPAMMLSAGLKSDDPAIDPAKISKQWEETRYHQPQDDMQQPGLNFDAATTYARLAFLCGYLVAQETERPRWNSGDFFGEEFGKK